ncbi:MAG: ABC transporter substrate-binding protein [Deltaproteobacteria bacterium]|nr:ABC transporter substrate-binding protein [Deltaproteobacteria bacterium]
MIRGYPPMNAWKSVLPPLLLIVVNLLFVLTIVSSCKPQAKNGYLIGYINPNPEETEGAQGFLRNMPAFGYIEGKNVTYIKFEKRDHKEIEAAAKDMVAKKADLIFTMTTPAAKLAKKAVEGTKIPIVFVMYDAIESGVVESMVKHGGNITGVQLTGSTRKALDWLLAISPRARNIFVPVCFDTGAARHSLEDLKKAAAHAGLKVTVSEVDTLEKLRKSLSAMPADAGAVFILHSWLIGSNMETILDSAKKRNIPVISAGHVNFDGGVVFSYGPLDDRTGMQAARLAHGILKGASPRDLPVETSDFYLGINLKSANALGVKIPDDVLQQADYIIR